MDWTGSKLRPHRAMRPLQACVCAHVCACVKNSCVTLLMREYCACVPRTLVAVKGLWVPCHPSQPWKRIKPCQADHGIDVAHE